MQHKTDICYFKSPIGWLKIEANELGLTNIDIRDKAPQSSPITTNPHLREAYKQLGEYFQGERAKFNLAIDPKGTDFQKEVWNQLLAIPFGKTVSYKDIATNLGNPDKARAVGMANNKNPLPIVVPCHRVINSNGNLSGYAFGEDIKEKLLKLELPKKQRASNSPAL